MAVVELSTEVLEKTTGLHEFDIVDELGDPVPSTDLATMTITYYDLETSELINSRESQNCLNAGNVAVDINGHVIWSIQVADSVLVDVRKELEQHIVLFSWETVNGVVGRHEVQFPIRNLTFVV